MNVINYDASMKNSSVASLEIFENPEFGEVRMALINGKPWFVGIDIARIMGYKRPTDAVRDVVPENHRVVMQLSDIQHYGSRPLPDNMKGSKIIMIDEPGFYRLTIKSSLPSAEPFIEWVTSEVLPTLREDGEYSVKKKPEVVKSVSLEEQVRAVGAAAEIFQKLLRASDASVAAYLNKGIVPLGLPPIDYVPSKGSKFSATDLLKKFNRTESIYKFNDRMVELGYLEEKTRPSTKTPDKTKKFKELTEAGLEFGENMVSPKNERETQPHYYEHRFGELLSILFG